jgi:hypothetical protein
MPRKPRGGPTDKELAIILGCSDRTIRRRRRKGTLPAILPTSVGAIRAAAGTNAGVAVIASRQSDSLAEQDSRIPDRTPDKSDIADRWLSAFPIRTEAQRTADKDAENHKQRWLLAFPPQIADSQSDVLGHDEEDGTTGQAVIQDEDKRTEPAREDTVTSVRYNVGMFLAGLVAIATGIGISGIGLWQNWLAAVSVAHGDFQTLIAFAGLTMGGEVVAASAFTWFCFLYDRRLWGRVVICYGVWAAGASVSAFTQYRFNLTNMSQSVQQNEDRETPLLRTLNAELTNAQVLVEITCGDAHFNRKACNQNSAKVQESTSKLEVEQRRIASQADPIAGGANAGMTVEQFRSGQAMVNTIMVMSAGLVLGIGMVLAFPPPPNQRRKRQ